MGPGAPRRIRVCADGRRAFVDEHLRPLAKRERRPFNESTFRGLKAA
jgi:hypothetical protein